MTDPIQRRMRRPDVVTQLATHYEIFHDVPTKNSLFVGREDILEKIKTVMIQGGSSPSGSSRRVALSGLGGMGKTQLMLQYCYLHRTEYRHIVWLKMNGRLAAMDSFQKLAQSLGLRTDDLNKMDFDKVIKWVQKWLERKGKDEKWLLLLDNV